MPVVVAVSPNPNAMKFSVGESVGGPITHVAGSTPEEPFARDLLAIPGVVTYGTFYDPEGNRFQFASSAV